MKLIDNAKEVLARAWSVRLATLASVFALVDVFSQMLPFLSSTMPDKTFTILSAACGVAAVLARVIRQPTIGSTP